MRFLLFSDLHGDETACAALVEKACHADLVIGAGDYANFRKNLKNTLKILSAIEVPVVLVHGNHESSVELKNACSRYDNFFVLHGNTVELNGYTFVGLGAGVPITPFGSWSVDLSEEDALGLLPDIKKKFIFISHSPPYSCLDQMFDGRNIGSRTVLNYIRQSKPLFVVCGHIHEQWGKSDSIEGVSVINAGPLGIYMEYSNSGDMLIND